MSKPLLDNCSYENFELITDNPDFINFIIISHNYFLAYIILLTLKNKDNDYIDEKQIKLATKKEHKTLEELSSSYIKLLINAPDFDTDQSEIMCFETIHTFVKEYAKRVKDIPPKYVYDLIDKLGEIFRSDKFNVEKKKNAGNLKYITHGILPDNLKPKTLRKIREKEKMEKETLLSNKYNDLSQRLAGVTNNDIDKVNTLNLKLYH